MVQWASALDTSSMSKTAAGERERTGAHPPFPIFQPNMIKTHCAWGVCAGLLALTACKDAPPSKAKPETAPPNGALARSGPDSVRILAATYPVAWLGCQVVGEPCVPEALVPPGASAHSWEPRPSDLRRLERATVFVQAGLAFESSWVPRFRASVRDLDVVDARGGLDLREEHHHDHGHEESDPHVWSSPRAMDHLADTLAARLVQARPELRGRVAMRLPEVHRRLLALDTAVRQILAPYTGRTFLVNHPGLGYLARDYGLIQKPLESHGQDLTPVLLWEVRKTAKAQGIRAVFVQSEYSRRVADQIARELGVGTVDMDLLDQAPYDSMFLASVKRMAEKL
jgi:zinc transport system substrate-binding protein